MYGQYQNGLILLKEFPDLIKTVQEPGNYIEYRKEKGYRYLNVEMFLDYLLIKAEFEQTQDFFKKPPAPILNDPVIDPRETWKEWIGRIAEFEQPKLVERRELPPELQPQNRFMGKLRMWVNGMDPNDYSQQESEIAYLQEQIPNDLKLEMSEISKNIKKKKLEFGKIEEISIQGTENDISYQNILQQETEIIQVISNRK